MPTVIHFVGRDRVMVREDEDRVQAAFGANGGMPAAFTHHRTGNPIYVNLGQVTYWQARGSREPTQLPWPSVERIPASR